MSEKHIENIDNFAKEHGVFFKQKGECGFGRPCVGLLSSEEGNYVDYNPTSDVYDDEVGFKPIFTEEPLFYDIAPEDAYHKHDCFAVLVHDDNYAEGIRQLSEWVDNLREMGVELKTYETGAVGIQALLSGKTGYAFVKKD